MRLPTAALVAGFLATTSAFLLPPNLDEIKEELKDEFQDARFRGAPKHFKDLIHSIFEDEGIAVDVECPGCPFAIPTLEKTDHSTGLKDVVWANDVENSIRLHFDTIGESLHVNSVPLLPPQALSQPPLPLKANQIRRDPIEMHSAEVRLSYVVSVLPPIPESNGGDSSLIAVELTILQMNAIPIKVNTVVVKLIRTPDQLFIAKIEQIPFEETPGADVCESASPWSVCRIKAIFMDKMRMAMHTTKDKAHKIHSWVKEKTGCGKHGAFFKRPHHDHPHEKHEKHEKHGKHARPHHDHKDHDEKHPRPYHDGKSPCHKHAKKPHDRFHRASHMIRQTLRFFVVPALLGIIGGLTASAMGMLVGQAIVYLWFRTYRNGERGPLRIYEREIAVIDEEQKELLEKDEALPMYEDAPAYGQTLTRDVEIVTASQENEKR